MICFFISKCENLSPNKHNLSSNKSSHSIQKDTQTLNRKQWVSSNTLSEKRFTGYDNMGRKIEYVIFIVKGFNWKKGEVFQSERNGKIENICEHMKEIGVRARINREDLKAIICFGNVSYDEIVCIPQKLKKFGDDNKAELRAGVLANCVASLLTKTTPVITANLGNYLIKEEVSTYQREIIVIGVLEKESNVIDNEALFNGLMNLHLKEGWQIDISQYSNVYTKIDLKNYIN